MLIDLLKEYYNNNLNDLLPLINNTCDYGTELDINSEEITARELAVSSKLNYLNYFTGACTQSEFHNNNIKMIIINYFNNITDTDQLDNEFDIYLNARKQHYSIALEKQYKFILGNSQYKQRSRRLYSVDDYMNNKDDVNDNNIILSDTDIVLSIEDVFSIDYKHIKLINRNLITYLKKIYKGVDISINNSNINILDDIDNPILQYTDALTISNSVLDKLILNYTPNIILNHSKINKMVINNENITYMLISHSETIIFNNLEKDILLNKNVTNLNFSSFKSKQEYNVNIDTYAYFKLND